MTYSELKILIDQEYADFTFDYIKRRRIGANSEYTTRDLYFSKVMHKVLLRQEGDENLDSLLKEDIQNIIRLFNKYAKSLNQIEYD